MSLAEIAEAAERLSLLLSSLLFCAFYSVLPPPQTSVFELGGLQCRHGGPQERGVLDRLDFVVSLPIALQKIVQIGPHLGA